MRRIAADTDDSPAPSDAAAAPGAGSSEERFLRMYDENVDAVHAFFAYRVGNRADVEDLTQTVFERAVASWRRFDADRTKPITWLIAISRNLLVDRHRRSEARPVTFVGDLAALERAGTGPLDAEPALPGVEPELERALAKLSERERELIALRYGADLPGAEIAELTSLSLANVQQILSRSVRKLRSELE